MANNKSNKTTKPATSTPVESKVEEVVEVPLAIVEVDEEKEALKVKLEEMQKQMAFLMGQMSAQTETTEKKPSKERNIPFINLTAGTFVLKGTQYWDLIGQFSQRVFLEREARIIVNNMQNAIRSGLVYIADAKFVEENELEEAYRGLLNDKQFKTLLDNKYEYVIEVYKNASPSQQNIIIDMISDKRANGESVDGNVLLELGKLSGKDLVNIEPEKGD